MNLGLYLEEIHYEGFSIFSGGDKTSGMIHYSKLPKTAICDAFLADDDIQQMEICSTNIGFGRKFTKQFRKAEAQ